MVGIDRREISTAVVSFIGKLMMFFLVCQENVQYCRWHETTTAEGRTHLYYHVEEYAAERYLLAALILITFFEAVGIWYGIRKNGNTAGLMVIVGTLVWMGCVLQAYYDPGDLHLLKHLLLVGVGMVTMLLAYVLVRRFHTGQTQFLQRLIFGLILLALAAGVLSRAINGSSIWIRFGGFSLQLGEFLKTAFVVLFASLFQRNMDRRTMLIAFAEAFGAALLLVFQRDFGNAAVIFLLTVMMIFVLSDKLWMMALLSGMGVAVVTVAYYCLDYVRLRFSSCGIALASGSGQIYQSLMAIVQNGFTGNIHNTIPATQVSYSYTDFAYNSLVSIFGVSAGVLIIVLIALLLVLIVRNPVFSMYHYQLSVLAAGVIFAQVFLHMGGNLNVLPFTGIVLPFISRGGSNMVNSFFLIGVIYASMVPEFKESSKKLEHIYHLYEEGKRNVWNLFKKSEE